MFPHLTAVYGGLLGLMFLVLSLAVAWGRFRFGAHHGDAGQELLRRLIRIHANFAEYVPLTLVLIGLAEAQGRPPALIHALLAILLVARLLHPLGMLAPVASQRQFVLRAPSMLATWAVMGVAAALLVTGA